MAIKLEDICVISDNQLSSELNFLALEAASDSIINAAQKLHIEPRFALAISYRLLAPAIASRSHYTYDTTDISNYGRSYSSL